MDKTNDYEKAKQECWGDLYNEKLRYETQIEQVNRREVFDYVFDRAYQLGKAHAQPANGLVNERLQVAAMAMQGLLAGGIKKVL